MNDDKLKKANNLQRELEGAKDHLGEINSHRQRQSERKENISIEMKIHVGDNYHSSYSNLKPILYPISSEDFLNLYEMKLKKKIEELEKEFSSL